MLVKSIFNFDENLLLKQCQCGREAERRNENLTHGFRVAEIYREGLGAPTSSLAEEGVDAEEDLGVLALDQGQSSARWHRPALTGFWWM
jgi:hypothetical protein